MAKLIWGALGDRFYESGVDRGVLYPNGVPGVAWNGLVAVREGVSGGAARPYYFDGFKYINLAEAEEFVATLEAYSSPAEFAACDGTAQISNGLFVTQQPRRHFGLCYRTRVGNALDGDLGYKIHLVYNALAAPSARENTTLGSSAEATRFSWEISTYPPSISGYKPTAHLVVDSRRTPKLLLAALEDILYGTDSAQPDLPTVQEITELFASPGPVSRTNLLVSPRFTQGFTVAATGGSATHEVISDPAGNYLRITITGQTTSSANTGVNLRNMYTSAAPAPGEVYSASAEIRVSVAKTMQVALQYLYNGGTHHTANWALLTPGVWTRIKTETKVVPDDLPGALTTIQVLVYGLSGTAWVPGDIIEVRNPILEKASFVGSYFDGDSLDAGGVSYEWAGVANNSLSRARTWGAI